MMKTLFSIMIACFLLIACSDGNSVEEIDNLEETEDVETLISTNEKLVEQLERKLEEKNQLQDRIKSLEDENSKLKDDILTYKQETIEIEKRHKIELSLRDELDVKARKFFQSMHEEKHDQLEQAVSSNISVVSKENILNITDPDGIIRNFHYLQLDTVLYLRQSSFSFDHDEQIFTARYELYSDSDNSMIFDSEVELVFVDEDEWKVSSIRYVQS